MANYYVDFSSGTNGTGSAASPWNVFTSTQSASVNAGDSVWFRRYIVPTDTKFIAWKAGTDSDNRINYIGWPFAGDEHYDIRENSLRLVWDTDSTQYAYQRRLNYIAETPAAGFVANINVHRFYISDEFGNSTNIRTAITIKNISNVTLKNCYAYIAWLPPSTNDTNWWGGVLYCEGAYYINIINSTIDGTGTTSFSRNTTLKLKNSLINFSNCNFLSGSPGVPVVSYLSSAASSYAENSILTFNTCNFSVKQSSSNIASTYSETIFYSQHHFVNCTTTFSGCTMGIDATSLVVNSNPISTDIPVSFMRFAGGSVDIQNTTTLTRQHKYTMFELMDNVSATINNVDWTVNDFVVSNMFIFLKTTINSLNLSNITGTVPYAENTSYNDTNFFAGFTSWDVITSNSITISNITNGLGYVLDASRTGGATQKVNILNLKNSLLKYEKVYTSSVTYFEALNSDIGGLFLVKKAYLLGDFIQGSTTLTNIDIKLTNSTISRIPIQIESTNLQNVNATIYNCVGAGTDLVKSNNNADYSLNLVAVRNRGFSGIGTITDRQWLNARAILNDFNNGTAQYITYETLFETSIVSRAGGAGYSIKIIKKLDNSYSAIYPNLGEDSTWIYFPLATNYTVTAYFMYTASSGALTSDDIKIGIDIMDAYSYEHTTSTLSSDNSTWSGVPESMTIIKLVSVVTIPKEQYAPVKVYLNKRLPGLIVYFDPKLTVEES